MGPPGTIAIAARRIAKVANQELKYMRMKHGRHWLTVAAISVLGPVLVVSGIEKSGSAAISPYATPCTSADLHGAIKGTTLSAGRDATLIRVTDVGCAERAVVGGTRTSTL